MGPTLHNPLPWTILYIPTFRSVLTATSPDWRVWPFHNSCTPLKYQACAWVTSVPIFLIMLPVMKKCQFLFQNGFAWSFPRPPPHKNGHRSLFQVIFNPIEKESQSHPILCRWTVAFSILLYILLPSATTLSPVLLETPWTYSSLGSVRMLRERQKFNFSVHIWQWYAKLKTSFEGVKQFSFQRNAQSNNAA